MEHIEEASEHIQPGDTGVPMDTAAFQALVGKRLLEIRTSIKPKLTQMRLAKELDLNQGNIQRLESAGRGTVENLLVILNYYLKQDFNLNYILAEDNSMFTPRLRPEDKVENLDSYFERLE
ncbi:hypothetical protein [Rufibacter sp. XAAS-G3-1]|uniref:hypothetical protein n=1 Tax=Rufibacter sp. XAAS-G3-1 TaxID=2729134 RepID=UPI0015E73964|nr:hypothetical protein [Rufibacter sp. XAAS-G3-1]